MAILEKRKAVNQLPRFERYQDTRGGDRAAALRGETPITSAIRQLAGSSGYGPMGEAQGFGPMGGRGIGPDGTLGTGAAGFGGRPAAGARPGATSLSGPAVAKGLTSTTAGAGPKGLTSAPVTSKAPGLTTGAKTAATTPKSLTSTGTGAAKTPAGTTAATTVGTGKTLTSTGSGTGAAVTNKAGNQSTASSIGKTITNALTGAALGAGTKLAIDKLTGGTKNAVTSKVTDAATKAVDSLTKGTGLTSTTKTAGTGTTGTGTVGTGTTGTTKVGTTGTTKTGTTTGTTGATTSPVTTKPGITSTTIPVSGTVGPKAITGAGPKTPVGPKAPAGTGAKTRSMAGTAGAAGTAGTTDTNVSAQTNPAYDDEGNLMPGYELDEDGNPVWMGDKETSTTFNPDGTTGDTVTGAEGNDTLLGGEGNDTLDGEDNTDNTDNIDMSGELTDDQGNVYDADGNLLRAADNGEDQTYTDEYGNTYNASGDLIAEGDHSQFTQQDEYGNTYDWDGNLIEEGDHSLYTQTDEFGNTYDYDGNLVSYAEGYDPESYGGDDNYASDNTYGGDDTILASGDDEDLVGKKGGLFGLAKGGSVDDPIHEKHNGDGTITQMFDDGSFVTYNEDGDVIRVSEGDEVQKFDRGGQAYAPVSTAANYQRNGYLTGASQGPLQKFLDRLPQEGDNGPQSEGDGNGFPISTTYYNGGADSSDINESDMGTSTTYNEDGTAYVVDNATGDVIDMLDANGNSVGGFDNAPANNNASNSNGSMNGTDVNFTDNGDGTASYWDGQEYVTVDSDTGNELSRTDQNGDLITVDAQGNRTTTDGFGNVVSVYDAQGNKIPLSGLASADPITSTGGSGGVSTTKPLTAGQKKQELKDQAGETAATNDFLDKIKGSLGGYGGSALAGAVLGGLLGNEELFGGNSTPSQSIDMSKVGVINPRTTDFGIGPSNFVGYDQYGTPERMPELYGRELYQNLNAPGFNEVNPGDYARMDAEDSGDQGNGNQPYPESYIDYAPPPNDGVYGNQPPEDDYDGGEQMAEGGLPSGGLGGMQTYYTFGKPTDPMENLYNPQPAQQGMPPQAAQNQRQMGMNQPVQGVPPGMPQGAPQGQNMGMAKPQMPQQNPMQTGPQGLKSGGLPAWSNVPITAGRLNFRHGAPVHGAGDGQSDDIPAMLADGEYVIDAETVAQIGNGSTKAGAAALDKFRENIRAHKRSAPINKIPPKTKALTSYLKGAR